MKKVGNDAWTVPIGTVDYFARAGMTAPVNATAAISAKYYDTGLGSRTIATSDTATLKTVSGVEYWDIHRVTGTAADSVKLTLYFENFTRSGITDINTLRVAHYYSAAWHDYARETNGANWVRSSKYFTSFSPVGPGGGGGGANPLPIGLLQFTANLDNEQVVLQWITASEVNNDYFTVEKTKDGVHFETVAEVPGAGNSLKTRTYSAVDMNPYEGVSYYRLKQTDFDGKFTVSDLVPVSFTRNVEEDKGIEVHVFPNPVYFGEKAYLKVTGLEYNERVQVVVIDVNGRVISTKAMNILSTEWLIPIDPYQRLSAGTYKIIVRTDKETVTETYVVK